MMIGDSLSKDVVGAKALGMQAIWLSLNSSETLEDVQIRPDYEAKHPLDIIKIIENITEVKND